MKLRRTLLWVNGNDTEKIDKAIASGTDCVVFDLEDGVPAPQKEEARAITAKALRERNFRGKERIVRINHLDTPDAMKDLEAILPSLPDAIRLPKCESVEYVLRLGKILSNFEQANGLAANTIEIILMIETARGAVNSYALATACERVTAMGIGMEDMTASLGLKRHYELGSHDLLFVRQKIVLDACAAGVQPLDACVLFLGNTDYIREDTENIKRDGFVGRSVYDLSQVDAINEVFTPSTEEIDWAKRVIQVYENGKNSGVAEIRLDEMYIDPPVIAKAERILKLQKVIETRAGCESCQEVV